LREGCTRMPTFYYHGRRKGGHAPGHIRDAFRDAMWAFIEWDRSDPEPTVEVEVHYQPRKQVCGLLWNCSDILPGRLYGQLTEACGVDALRQTYAAAARLVSREITALPAR
jgi:hypothetical protein